MAFNDLVRTATSVCMSALGEPAQITRSTTAEVFSGVQVVIDRDVEAIDGNGQVVGRTNTVCIEHSAITFTPVRGDIVLADSVTYTLGKRLEDDGFAYLFEATT